MHFSPILPEYEPYEEALYKGVQEGLIVPTDPALPFGPPDDFSHLLRKPGEQPGDSQGIDLELRNMRRIFPAAQVFLKYLVRMGKSARIMELGPGALRAATQTAQIFSDARIPVEIHTAGLTPASPFHALNYSFSDILSDRRGELARVIDSLPAGELRRSLQLTMDVTPLYSSLRLDAALAISDQFRPAIFSVLDKPFVDRQHINRLMSALKNP